MALLLEQRDGLGRDLAARRTGARRERERPVKQGERQRERAAEREREREREKEEEKIPQHRKVILRARATMASPAHTRPRTSHYGVARTHAPAAAPAATRGAAGGGAG